MKKLITVLLLTLSFTANATTYYFSANGNDANNGTSTSTPWKTLSKFNSVSGSLSPGDNVLFNRGDVFYGSITIKKSGTSGSPITIGAYGTGAMPVITGFTTVSAWTNLGSNIWESTAAVSTLSTCNMVTINGVNTAMGRYPNSGYLTYQSYSAFTSITSSSLTGSPNWAGAELVMFAKAYAFSRAPIIAQSGGTLTYTSQITDYNHTVPGFFIQNDARTLDLANEWYYNPSTKKIRVYNTSTPANVQLTTVDTLAYINKHDYITFGNISFKGSNGNSIVVNTSTYITIQNCDFNFSGKDAIYRQTGNSTGLKIENCTINHSNNNGIDIGVSNNATIRLNTIKNSGVVPGMNNNNTSNCIAILAVGANTLMEYNSIDSSGYNGIQFLGNNTSVNNNYIQNTCLVLGIGGGIYTWNGVPGPTQTGIKIKNNIIINYGVSSLYAPQNAGLSYGLFFDDWSNNMEVSGNSLAGCGWGICIHNSYSMNIHDNTMYNHSKNAIIIIGDNSSTQTMAGMIVKNNIFFAKNANDYTLWLQPPAVDGSLLPSYNSDSNYYARPIDGNGTSILTWLSGSNTHRNLSTWKPYSRQDAHSGTTPKAITSTDSLRFEYNATNSPVTRSLPYNYEDVKGVQYNGNITLQPYTSAVLIQNGAATTTATNSTVQENILNYSEDLTNSVWHHSSAISIIANDIIAPDGNKTASRVTTTTGLDNLYQTVTVLPSTTYTFSFYALKGTIGAVDYNVQDINIAGISLKGKINYSGLINTSTWTRISVTFTTGATTTNIIVLPKNDGGTAGYLWIWGAQLNRGSTAANYIKTPATSNLGISMNTPVINEAILSGVKAYPNPFGNYIEINITGGIAGEYKLILVDVSGKIIWTKSGIKNAGDFQQSINTSSLQRGIYILKVTQNNTNSVIKLVK